MSLPPRCLLLENVVVRQFEDDVMTLDPGPEVESLDADVAAFKR